jgi:hypothetical protein
LIQFFKQRARLILNTRGQTNQRNELAITEITVMPADFITASSERPLELSPLNTIEIRSNYCSKTGTAISVDPKSMCVSFFGELVAAL